MPSLQKGNRPGTANSKRSSGGPNMDGEYVPSGKIFLRVPTLQSSSFGLHCCFWARVYKIALRGSQGKPPKHDVSEMTM